MAVNYSIYFNKRDEMKQNYKYLNDNFQDKPKQPTDTLQMNKPIPIYLFFYVLSLVQI